MRLWTIQGIKIYEQLQREGIAFCTKPFWGDIEEMMRAYHWMSEQMKQRIGEPPLKEIKYPMWAWYQYDSAKSNKPPKSTRDIPDGISAYMELLVPDKDVLLSDFSNWHAALNGWALTDWKDIEKKTDVLDKDAGRKLKFDEYPEEIQMAIEKSWEAIFDLYRRDADVGRQYVRNRSIQATFWALKPEYIVSVEFLEKKGEVIKVINWPK